MRKLFGAVEKPISLIHFSWHEAYAVADTLLYVYTQYVRLKHKTNDHKNK